MSDFIKEIDQAINVFPVLKDKQVEKVGVGEGA